MTGLRVLFLWVIWGIAGAAMGDGIPFKEEKPVDDPQSEEEVRALFARIRGGDAGGLKEAVAALEAKSFAERQAAEKELAGMFWLTPGLIRRQFGKVDPELEYRLARIAKGSEGAVLAFVGSVRAHGVDKFAGELFEVGETVGDGGLLGKEILGVLLGYEGKISDGDVLKRNLGHGHPEYRRIALGLLVRSFESEGREAAGKLLEDADEKVRLAAASVLIRAGERRGAAELVALLGSKDERVRERSHGLLSALAKKDLAGFQQAGELRIWEEWLAGVPDPVPLPEGGFEELLYWDADGVRTLKRRYRVGEKIGVEVTKFSGSHTDWVTVTGKGVADSTYGQYFYGGGKKEGDFVFEGMSAPGEYEVRVYDDWPKGHYEVKARYGFSVE